MPGDSPDVSGPWRRIGIYIGLVLFGGMPLWIGLLSWISIQDGSAAEHGPALGSSAGEILTLVAVQMTFFLFLFGIFLFLTRLTRKEMGLVWQDRRGGFAGRFLISFPIGIGYSLALRIGLGIIVMVIVLILSSMGIISEDDTSNLAPNIDSLVDAEALSNDPLYMVMNLTVVSFVFAGFREELWRGASLAALKKLFPKRAHSKGFQVLLVCLLALVFGVGHIPQGIMGVALTTLLGVGLGLIQVFHKSIWEATMAHAFFNATSFLLMPLLPRLMEMMESQGLFHF